MSTKKYLIPLGIIMFVVAMYFGWLKFHDTFSNEPAPQNNDQVEQIENETVEEEPVEPDTSFDKTTHSTETPGSIWWVVNRNRPLPDGYTPPDLKVPNVVLRLGSNNEQMQISSAIEPALIDMFNAARASSVNLIFGSGYRSQTLQAQFYNNYVASDGQAAADRYSARPGTSEHQTGLSFDATSVSRTCHLEICFKDTPEGIWLAQNAHNYGFIVRYLEGKENITGYQYEPWHMRYVGVELATELKNTKQTMEEFFGLDPVILP